MLRVWHANALACSYPFELSVKQSMHPSMLDCPTSKHKWWQSWTCRHYRNINHHVSSSLAVSMEEFLAEATTPVGQLCWNRVPTDNRRSPCCSVSSCQTDDVLCRNRHVLARGPQLVSAGSDGSVFTWQKNWLVLCHTSLCTLTAMSAVAPADSPKAKIFQQRLAEFYPGFQSQDYFNLSMSLNLTALSELFVYYDSAEAINDYVTSAEYATEGHDNLYAAIIFDSSDGNDWSYTIRMNQSEVRFTEK